MITQIKLMAALELKNLYGLNVLRHTKDKSVKNRARLLGVAWVLLILMVAGYVGGLAYGLVYLGMGSVAPAYLTVIASVVILAFGIFKAGGVIFNRNGYDIITSLPLPQEAVVAGRFIRMYIEDLLMTLAVLLPGGAMYAFAARPDWFFYPAWLVSMILIPLLPLSVATLLGAVVAGISSRMKNKAGGEVVLSVGLVVLIMWGSTALGTQAESITPEMLTNLAEIVGELIGKIYPPAMWLGSAMTEGSIGALLLCAAVYLAVFAAVIIIVSRNFHTVCRRLNTTTAKHNYRMERLESSSVLKSLWRREVKRYFSSGVYVTNTIMGPVMGTVMAAAYLLAGQDSVNNLLGVELDLGTWLPFVVAGSFAMMPTTATSVSMEGKNWWITKSLPLPTKQIMTAKVLMNLSLMLPFYLVAEVMMVIALKPGLMELVWLLVIPAAIILFACVFGITGNLLLPNFNWDSEVSVVKQSAAAAVGGFGGLLATVIFAVAVLLSGAYADAVKLGGTLALFLAAALLHRKNCSVDLRKL